MAPAHPHASGVAVYPALFSSPFLSLLPAFSLLSSFAYVAFLLSQPKTFAETHLLMALHLMMISLYEENRCLENDDISFQFLTKAKEIDWTPPDPEQADKG